MKNAFNDKSLSFIVKKPSFSLLFFLLFSFVVFPQQNEFQPELDRLEQELSELNDTNRVKGLLMAAEENVKGEPQKANFIAKKALLISQESNYQKGETESYLKLAVIASNIANYNASYDYAIKSSALAKRNGFHLLWAKSQLYASRSLFNQSKYDEAIAAGNQLIAFSHQHQFQEIIARVHKLKGVCFQFLGRRDSSDASFRRAISKFLPLVNQDTTHSTVSSLASSYLRLYQTDSALFYYKKVDEFARRNNNNFLIVENNLNMCTAFRTLGEMENAFQMAQEAIVLLEKINSNTSLKKQAYVQLGLMERDRGNFKKAIDYLEKAIVIVRQVNDQKFLSIFLTIVGEMHVTLEQYTPALECLNEAENINKVIDFKSSASTCFRLLTTIHREMGDYEKAWEYLHKTEQIDQEIKDDLRGVYTLIERGKIQIDVQQLDSAKHSFKKAYQKLGLNRISKPKLEVCVNLVKVALLQQDDVEVTKWMDEAIKIAQNIKGIDESYLPFLSIYAEVLMHQKKYEKSIAFFKKAIEANIKMQVPSIDKNCFAGLAAAYSRIRRFEEAFYFQNKHMLIKDSLSKLARLKQAMQLRTQYESQQKDQQIVAMEREQELQELTVINQRAELIQQRQYLFLLLLSIFLIGSVSLLFFNRYKLKRKNETLILQTKQLELERKQEKTDSQLEMAELRSEFFTNVSHEFRTPLTLILGPLKDLLKQKDLSYQKKLEGIYSNASQLLSLVNETLNFSKLKSGHLPLDASSLKLGTFIKEQVQSFTVLSESQGTSIEFIDESQDCIVDFDANKLKKVITNLLSNAFKHTKQGDAIVVKIHAFKEESICISITDTGAGIAQEHLPYIFDRFYQANHQSTGTGVGLSLSKQLVELHGGKITVKSTPAKGSKFEVSIPIKQQTNSVETINTNADTIRKQEFPNENSSSKTVLVIEDNDQLRQYLKELLQAQYQVISAADGEEGIALAEQHSPELIVSDVMMPKKDGLALTRYLKQHLPTSHIPIILLTAKASIESKLQGLEIGADDYLTKPFDSRELLERCKNLIQQREQLRTLFSTNYFVSPKKIAHNELDQQFLSKAINIIEDQDNFPDLSVEQLCKELAYNRSGVHLKLKALTGKNTTAFIKSIRLKKAAKLIRETHKNMNEIAAQVGFGSRQTFNRAFKEQFDLTPTEFRKQDGPLLKG